jgi:hypothetical protein
MVNNAQSGSRPVALFFCNAIPGRLKNLRQYMDAFRYLAKMEITGFRRIPACASYTVIGNVE